MTTEMKLRDGWTLVEVVISVVCVTVFVLWIFVAGHFILKFW